MNEKAQATNWGQCSEFPLLYFLHGNLKEILLVGQNMCELSLVKN